METLAEYHSYNNQIADLKEKLEKAQRRTEVWKYKYKKIADKYEVKTDPLVSRGEKAGVLINELRGTGRNSVLIREVAKKCFLSEHTVKRLWYENERQVNHANN